MNKIIMDGEKTILNNYESEIMVSNDCRLYILNHPESLTLNIVLNDNSSLEIYDFNLYNKDVKIEVIQNNNSQFNYLHTFKIDGEYHFQYKALMQGNNNINNISIRGVSLGSASLDIDGDVSKDTIGNELNEDIKILTTKGKAFIAPMMHINTLDVLANHNTAISNIREEELFYLMSKGIDRVMATNLIEDGYLYGLFKNTEFYELTK